jgi:two-component SAPR family response regulator
MSSTTKNVWIVDDDPLQVLILNRLFASQSHMKSPKFFSGGKAAIDALNGGKISADEVPDLIFLDLIMVKGDGWSFLDYYKKIKSKLVRGAKIVVISSYNDENFKKLKQYPEVVHYLSKPVGKREFEELMEALRIMNSDEAEKAEVS